MSYILEALRKADQQRQLGATPTLRTAPAATAPVAKPALSLNAWLGIALLGLGILLGWWQPWQTATAPSPSPQAMTPARQAATETGNSVSRETLPSRPAADAPAPAAVNISSERTPPATTMPSPAQLEIPPAPPGSITITPSVKPGPTNEAASAAGQRPASDDSRILTYDDLPVAIRQEIPKLSISFHVYVPNPYDRRVMINNEMLRQGQALEPGLKIEQITPDGVIIDYKTYRFREAVRR